ncbi:DUF6036 family nucleotidyltransferase [Pseudoxanthomonas kaohsiungensis]|uniref:DUF6036 family nucleotidyltransferase n=1 Tax=Pseudoxanthomonas kaohsiungensis TaxID=283923 RepID=A0ABW3M2B5_9GAMM|nr:DUF6036 family nucleotidyltransferase [Pseudoxanthomonas kaohsiungensis]KAF1702918.1 hypothetical protein CSC66_09085 [Pseudoxanthomonas kaohsiungensis]
MNRDALLHVLRAASEIAGGDVELLLLGSQAVLGAVESDNPALARSMEADVAALTPDSALAERIADQLSGAIGEGSNFSDLHGYYVDGVQVETARLAPGWEQRVSTIQFDAYGQTRTARCISPEDLAVSKLLAGREKDYEFVDALLDERIVSASAVRDLLATVQADPAQARADAWIEVRVDRAPRQGR